MTNVSISGLHVSLKDLGGTMLVTSAVPYFAYENGVKTDKLEGYKYVTVLPERSFEKLDVKVPGNKRLDIPAGQYISVRYEGLEVKLYFDNSNRVRLTAKAANVCAVPVDKPTAKA